MPRRPILATLPAIAISAAFSLWVNTVEAQVDEGTSFNKYVLKAVNHLQSKYPSQGYNINRAYTHNINYRGEIIKATNPPMTMCVAAVAEVIIYAIKIYTEETGDGKAIEYFGARSWGRMTPVDIRSHIWVDRKLDSFGTADALVTFAMGARVPFRELKPGSFINLNRNRPGKKPTGHAVVFISYLDKDGTELAAYSDKVAGFKYWSAQGKDNIGDAGYAYRYAFLNTLPSQKGNCPDLGPTKKVDCWIVNSKSSKMLNTGYMLHPSKWDSKRRDQNLRKIVEGLYEQTRSKGPNAIELDALGLADDFSFSQFEMAIEAKDTMSLNPIFPEDASTD